MDPIPPQDELAKVIRDLNDGRVVDVGFRGQVRHSDATPIVDSDDITRSLQRLCIPRRPYVVELQYPVAQKGPAGPVHPRVRVVHPEMSFRTYPRHPHMSSDAYGDSWPCPVSPHETSWAWTKGATWLYLAHVALWILKTEVWARTGGGIGSCGTWLGPGTPHTPSYIVGAVRTDGPCRCGSGGFYKRCHQARDILAAVS